MINRNILFLLTVFIFLGTTPSQSQNKISNNFNSVVADNDQISLIFKIEVNDNLKWYSKDVNTGSLEYQWTANFTLDDQSYSAGVSLFKHPGAQQKTGTLEELIDDAQTSIFESQIINVEEMSQERSRVTGMRTIMRGVKIRSVLKDGALVIEILEEELVNSFLLNKPESVKFITKTPETSYNAISVKVDYR